MKEDLLATVQPGQLVLDALPPRSLETHPDWLESGKQLYLIEIRTGIQPAPMSNAIPQRLNLDVEILNSSDTQMQDALPKSEITATGDYEFGLTNEGKFTTGITAKVGSKLGSKVGIESSVESSVESKLEESTTERTDTKIKFTGRTERIISYAVGQQASWTLLRTPDQPLAGGFTFSLTILVPATTTDLQMRLRAQVNYSNWGPVAREKEISVKTIKATAPTHGLIVARS